MLSEDIFQLFEVFFVIQVWVGLVEVHHSTYD
jgi:hypothetical protein